MGIASERFLDFLQDSPFDLKPNSISLDALKPLMVVERVYPAGAVIFDEGRTPRLLVVMVSGWALACRTMPDGRRLVGDFLSRGDLLSHGSLAGRAYRSVIAVEDITVFEISTDRLQPLVEFTSQITGALLRLMARNFGIATEHLTNVARRSPIERTAHLMLEMHYRLEQAGLASGNRFHFPFTQSDLADALGLTAIHMNRVLRDMREEGYLVFRNGAVDLLDLPALRAMTHFDPEYLKA